MLLDDQTLTQLVQMEAESLNLPHESRADVTEELREAADAWSECADAAIQEVAPRFGGDVDAILDDDLSGYLLLMTLQEHGVGIWDGRWDDYFPDMSREDWKQLQRAIEKQMRAEGCDDVALETALLDAAYECCDYPGFAPNRTELPPPPPPRRDREPALHLRPLRGSPDDARALQHVSRESTPRSRGHHFAVNDEYAPNRSATPDQLQAAAIRRLNKQEWSKALNLLRQLSYREAPSQKFDLSAYNVPSDQSELRQLIEQVNGKVGGGSSGGDGRGLFGFLGNGRASTTYEITYWDGPDAGIPPQKWRVRAHDEEEALERFEDGDEGYEVISVRRVDATRQRRRRSYDPNGEAMLPNDGVDKPFVVSRIGRHGQVSSYHRETLSGAEAKASELSDHGDVATIHEIVSGPDGLPEYALRSVFENGVETRPSREMLSFVANTNYPFIPKEAGQQQRFRSRGSELTVTNKGKDRYIFQKKDGVGRAVQGRTNAYKTTSRFLKTGSLALPKPGRGS